MKPQFVSNIGATRMCPERPTVFHWSRNMFVQFLTKLCLLFFQRQRRSLCSRTRELAGKWLAVGKKFWLTNSSKQIFNRKCVCWLKTPKCLESALENGDGYMM